MGAEYGSFHAAHNKGVIEHEGGFQSGIVRNDRTPACVDVCLAYLSDNLMRFQYNVIQKPPLCVVQRNHRCRTLCSGRQPYVRKNIHNFISGDDDAREVREERIDQLGISSYARHSRL